MRIFVVSIAVVSSRPRGRVPRASLAQDSDVDATRRFFANVSIDGWMRWRGLEVERDSSTGRESPMYVWVDGSRAARTPGRRDASCGAVRCVM